MRIVVLGLSITSSWGNGHATTYRALLKALRRRGHQLLFLERDVPWYASCRDLLAPAYADVRLYRDLYELFNYEQEVRDADAVIVGSYVPEGVKVAEWVFDTAKGTVAFYDIDTPVTLRKLADSDWEYLHAEQIPEYDLYLSFSSGPSLEVLHDRYRARRAEPLLCSVDPDAYYPSSESPPQPYLMSYMGTYCPGRQRGLQLHLLEVAKERPDESFTIAGPGFPDRQQWPANVTWREHAPPAEHRAFYNQARFTLNLTRPEMVGLGYSPSVRLFEAACCGAAMISDVWPGIESFLEPNEELLLSHSTEETLRHLELPESRRRAIGAAARRRILKEHSSDVRASQLEEYLETVAPKQGRPTLPASMS